MTSSPQTVTWSLPLTSQVRTFAVLKESEVDEQFCSSSQRRRRRGGQQHQLMKRSWSSSLHPTHLLQTFLQVNTNRQLIVSVTISLRLNVSPDLSSTRDLPLLLLILPFFRRCRGRLHRRTEVVDTHQSQTRCGSGPSALSAC